jgi:hypothetical protein
MIRLSSDIGLSTHTAHSVCVNNLKQFKILSPTCLCHVSPRPESPWNSPILSVLIHLIIPSWSAFFLRNDAARCSADQKGEVPPPSIAAAPGSDQHVCDTDIQWDYSTLQYHVAEDYMVSDVRSDWEMLSHRLNTTTTSDTTINTTHYYFFH